MQWRMGFILTSSHLKKARVQKRYAMDKPLIMCGSNNYLGLTTHPKVREAACKAVTRYGTSCSGSRFLNGTLALHEQLETELAEWVGKEAAITFTTGVLTNIGTISSIVGRSDIIILDKDDHASLVDGAILAAGRSNVTAMLTLGIWSGC